MAEATEARGSPGKNRRGARIAATKVKRRELLETFCHARRFRRLVEVWK